MSRWVIVAAITEYRAVVVEAETPRDALRKFRARDWEFVHDPDDRQSRVKKQGAVMPEEVWLDKSTGDL